MPLPDFKRPAISVVVPFAGSGDDAAAVIAQLEGLEVGPGDERIVADNSAAGVVPEAAGIRVVRAPRIGSSYYARNTGAAAAANDWLLLIDSDCVMPSTLLDDFFTETPDADVGIVAGEIEGDPGQTALIARYFRSRGHLSAGEPLQTGPSPAGGTANLLVRRAAWEELGGFAEVVSGADFEFSWRAGERGWKVGYRPEARVGHLHPERLRPALKKARRYGTGQRWVEGRYPGVPRKPGLLRELVRGAAGMIVWPLRGQFERGVFKGIDALYISAYASGWWFGSNEPRPPS